MYMFVKHFDVSLQKHNFQVSFSQKKMRFFWCVWDIQLRQLIDPPFIPRPARHRTASVYEYLCFCWRPVPVLWFCSSCRPAPKTGLPSGCDFTTIRETSQSLKTPLPANERHPCFRNISVAKTPTKLRKGWLMLTRPFFFDLKRCSKPKPRGLVLCHPAKGTRV